MSTSRFGDAEWGEQFERDDDELVDWPARDDLDEPCHSQADGSAGFDTSLAGETAAVAGRVAGVSAKLAASDAEEVLANQRANASFVSSDEDAA